MHEQDNAVDDLPVRETRAILPFVSDDVVDRTNMDRFVRTRRNRLVARIKLRH